MTNVFWLAARAVRMWTKGIAAAPAPTLSAVRRETSCECAICDVLPRARVMTARATAERKTCMQRAIEIRGLSKGQVPERDVRGRYNDRRVRPGHGSRTLLLSKPDYERLRFAGARCWPRGIRGSTGT